MRTNKMTQRETGGGDWIYSLGTCNHLVKEGLDQELFSLIRWTDLIPY